MGALSALGTFGQPIAPPPSLDSLVMYYGDVYGVDYDLIRAVIMQESSWNPRALNPSDPSAGLMQVMPSTAIQMSGVKSLVLTDLYDPQLNINVGTKYLSYLYRKYGDWSTAIAAYNWGEGHISRMLATGGSLPAVVQDYVNSVNGYWQAYKGGSIVSQTQTQLFDASQAPAPVPTVDQSPADIGTAPDPATVGLFIGGVVLLGALVFLRR